jgi:mono/diheme cytochrome c family protein
VIAISLQLIRHRIATLGLGFLGWMLVLAGTRPLAAQTQSPGLEQPQKLRTPEEQASLAEGQAFFRGLCSGCHGGAGRGGKGPDLTDSRWMHGDKDSDIARVIRDGVPKTTMKKLGESLKEEQIAKLVLYVRSLARSAGESTWQPYMAGDPEAGRRLFFDEKGKALRAQGHQVDVLAPQLVAVAGGPGRQLRELRRVRPRRHGRRRRVRVRDRQAGPGGRAGAGATAALGIMRNGLPPPFKWWRESR